MLSNNITQDNKIELILAANVVIIDQAKKANIILIISNIVSQTYTHSISAICAVFYNKARKAFKLGSFTRFA